MKPETRDEPRADVVTTDMKLDLIEKVRLMSNEGLTKLVDFVRGSVQSAVSDLEDDRLQIRVDDFDYASFQLVVEFVEDTLLRDQPSKRLKTGTEIVL